MRVYLTCQSDWCCLGMALNILSCLTCFAFILKFTSSNCVLNKSCCSEDFGKCREGDTFRASEIWVGLSITFQPCGNLEANSWNRLLVTSHNTNNDVWLHSRTSPSPVLNSLRYCCPRSDFRLSFCFECFQYARRVSPPSHQPPSNHSRPAFAALHLRSNSPSSVCWSFQL